MVLLRGGYVLEDIFQTNVFFPVLLVQENGKK